MDDMIARYLGQFATIGAIAMIASEYLTLPIGKTSPEPNKGNRKRYNALIYSFATGAAGWYAGFVKLPVDTWQKALVGVALMSVATVILSWGAVWATKKITAPNVSDGGGNEGGGS